MNSEEFSSLGITALILFVLYGALVLPEIFKNLSGRRR
jgi:hypothetical protein